MNDYETSAESLLNGHLEMVCLRSPNETETLSSLKTEGLYERTNLVVEGLGGIAYFAVESLFDRKKLSC
jgi:hypothetical protein